MPLVYGHGFVTLAVTDLEAAVDFYREACRLEVRERRTDEVFLTGNARHHWLRLVRGEAPGMVRLGYQAAGRDAIKDATRRLTAAGVPWSSGGDLAHDAITGSIRFTDPFGIEIELYDEMIEASSSPVPADVGLTDLLHAVVFVSDIEAARDFYETTLDMRRSDQIENLVVFMRGADNYHHSIAFARGQSGVLDHFAIIVDDLDTVMRFRTHAIGLGVLGDDVVRHAASGSVSVYLRDNVAGIGVEFCTGHQIIDDDDYNGRLLKAAPATNNVWARPFESPSRGPATEFSVGGATAAADLVNRGNAPSA